MDPFVKKSSWGRKFFRTVAIGSALIIGVLAVGGIAMRYISYTRSGDLHSRASTSSNVSISNPHKGEQYETGESVIVKVSAIGSYPFLSMELWLDGSLAGMQTAPEGGIHPFSTHFSWLPTEPGIHSLIAAAVDENGNKTMSSQVVVLITESKSETELATTTQNGSSSISPAPSGVEYTPPIGPGDGSSTEPAGKWTGSLSNWINSLTEDEKPTNPELVIRAGQCSANLLIHDLSNNEEGFFVYRQRVNSPAWQKIATLNSQSHVKWITYLDEGISGAVTYYVSAFNSQGEVESNLALVNIDPGDCPSEQMGTFAESTKITLKLTEFGAENIYCYLSQDRVNWSRWPMVGFLTPNEDGYLPESPLMLLRKNASGTDLDFMPMGLFMDCWGWQGRELIRIGDLSVDDLQPNLTGKQMIYGEGINASIISSVHEVLDLSNLYPFGDAKYAALDLGMYPDLIDLPPVIPVSLDIPRVNLQLTTAREECGMHIPPEAQNLLGKLFYCFPYPEYDPDKGGTTSQPYLVWGLDPEPNCAAGPGEHCKSYEELLALAEENGGQVGFEIITRMAGKPITWALTEPNLTMMVTPPFTCLGEMQYSVRLWYQPGNKGTETSAQPDFQISENDEFKIPSGLNQPILYGPLSNVVTIPCLNNNLPSPSVIEEIGYVDVTFYSLELFDQDDGVYGGSLGQDDRHLETYGYFSVTAPSMGQEFETPCFTPEIGTCESETYSAFKTRYLLVDKWGSDGHFSIYMPTTTSFPIVLQSEELCQSTTRYYCKLEEKYTKFKLKNNTLRIMVKNGDALTYEVNLMDHDEISDDDRVCYLRKKTLEFSLDEFTSTEKVDFTSKGDADDGGSCEVRIIIDAVSPYAYP